MAPTAREIDTGGAMAEHRTGTREQWREAREELLEREKAHLREGDELARVRRQLPWVRIEKEYRFDTDEGTRTLAELFDGRSQLPVYHLVFGVGLRVTDETEACTGCSFVADHFDAVLPHLGARDVTLISSSIAPLEPLQAYRRRMGWRFPWVSALGSDFHNDFGVAFTEEEQRSGAEYNYRHVAHAEP
jgi:predicted dithiol-disulfide oxidoreductase (DUF899 family)